MTSIKWTVDAVELAFNNMGQAITEAMKIPPKPLLAARMHHKGRELNAQEAVVELARAIGELHTIVANHMAAVSVVHEIEYV